MSLHIYHVTGVDVQGKRFPCIVTTNVFHAIGINLYRGSVWTVNPETGKRTLLRRIWN